MFDVPFFAAIMIPIVAIIGGISVAIVVVLPAIVLSRAQARDLQDGSRTSTGVRGRRWTRLLVLAEVAFACAILMATALLVRSVSRMLRAPTGVGERGIVAATLQLPSSGYRTWARVDEAYDALLASLRAQPGIARKLAAGEALFGTIDTYLIYRLTREQVFATDHTNASRTLLFDIARLQWDEELCRWWEVPCAALPEVRESAAEFGTTTLAGVLPRPIPICGVMGDSQASLFAQRCFERGMAKVTFGSGSSVLLNVGVANMNNRITEAFWADSEPEG